MTGEALEEPTGLARSRSITDESERCLPRLTITSDERNLLILAIPENVLDPGFIGTCKIVEQQARAAVFIRRDAQIGQKFAVIRVNDGRGRDPGGRIRVLQEHLNARANLLAYLPDLCINLLERQSWPR
jgi:hypothetical protein